MVVLSILGKPVSKKNRYTPIAGHFIKDSKLQTEIDRLSMQIPATARGLKLVSPDVEFWFYVKDRRSDRDGWVVTFLDILKDMGVIRNDSIKQFNGTLIIHPAILSDDWTTEIRLEQNAAAI